MSAWRGSVVLLLVALVSLPAAAGPKAPAKTPGGPAARPAASPGAITFTPKEVESFVAEVVPRIEQIMQRKFKSIPPLVVGDAEAVARILAGDLEPTIRKENPELSGAQLAEAALEDARARMPNILGKYGMKAKKLGLMPANLALTLHFHRIDRKHATGILRIVIAHEITHALQAQYVDILDLLTKGETEDATAAYTAVIEGQAMFIQDRIGQALALVPAAEEYAKTFSAAGVDFPDDESRHAALYQEFIYMAGKRFTEHHYAKGGAARLWEILAHPPTATSMIGHPETYSASPPPRPDLSKVFAVPADDFGKRRWTLHERDLGEIHLRAFYADMDQTALDTFTGSVVAARGLSAQSTRDDAALEFTLFLLTDKSAAAKTIELLRGPIAEDVKAATEEGTYRIKRSSDTKLTEIPCDASRVYTAVLADAAGKDVVEKRFILAARGTILLELQGDNCPLPSKRLQKILEGVFQSATEATGRQKAPPR